MRDRITWNEYSSQKRREEKRISQEEIDKAKSEYLSSGGGVEKLPTMFSEGYVTFRENYQETRRGRQGAE